MYKEIFPERIKKARIEAGYTQPQVAEELNIPKSSISKYETGNLEPDLEKLAMLADFYSVSIDWLLGLVQKEFIYTAGKTAAMVKELNRNAKN